MLNLQAFPKELFNLIVEHLVITIGIYKAVRLRCVNSKSHGLRCHSKLYAHSNRHSESFNSAILYAICNKQVLDIDDPATTWLSLEMSMPLKGKILLSKARSNQATKNEIVSVISKVNNTLDGLTKSTGDLRIKQHQMIAEAVAHGYGGHSGQLRDGIGESNTKLEMQDTLSGAIVLGNLPLVKSLLLESSLAPANINAENAYFGRPLQIAIAWGHLHIFRFLLECGADPLIYGYEADWHPNLHIWIGPYHVHRSPEGSALRVAALTGQEQIVHLLLQPEYCIPTTKVEYLGALVAAARSGHLRIVELLINATGKTLSEIPRLGEQMLWEAVRHHQQSMVQMLLDSGVDVDAIPCPDVYRFGNALSIAASKDDLHMLRFLLDRGANAGFAHPSRQELDPIAVAADHGHEAAVDLLLQHGADSTKAFRHAANGGQARLLKWLLGQDPNLYSKPWTDGNTVGLEALQRAILVKNLDVISLLVEAGVPLNDGCTYRDLPIVWAKTYSKKWVVEFLLSLGAEDQNDIDDQKKGYSDEEFIDYTRRSGVSITKRTWQWVSKY